jgi:hypothetical protein
MPATGIVGILIIGLPRLEVGNEINVSVDGTNSRYTGRGLFLLPDETGETARSLTAVGTTGCSPGGGNGSSGVLHRKLTSSPPTVYMGNTHTNVSTSLDMRSSTVPRDPYAREDAIDFRTWRSSP